MPPPTVVTAQAPGVKIVINYCLATYIIHGVRNITDSTPTCWNESSKMLVLLTVILTWLGRALDCKQNRVIILTVKIKVLLQWYSWVHTYIHTVLKKQCRTVSRLQGTPIGECKIMNWCNFTDVISHVDVCRFSERTYYVYFTNSRHIVQWLWYLCLQSPLKSPHQKRMLLKCHH